MKVEYSGLDEVSKMFDELGENAQRIVSTALYDGAGLMADEIRKAVPEDTGDLARSLDIQKFRKSYRRTETTICFTGYDSKGAPNPVKAAVLESGSSKGHVATHFFSRAVRNAKKKVENLIGAKMEQEIYEITRGK